MFSVHTKPEKLENATIVFCFGLVLEETPRVGGGGYLTKFNTGRLHPEIQPLTLLYTILAEKVPLLYTFY